MTKKEELQEWEHIQVRGTQMTIIKYIMRDAHLCGTCNIVYFTCLQNTPDALTWRLGDEELERLAVFAEKYVGQLDVVLSQSE